MSGYRIECVSEIDKNRGRFLASHMNSETSFDLHEIFIRSISVTYFQFNLSYLVNGTSLIKLFM